MPTHEPSLQSLLDRFHFDRVPMARLQSMLRAAEVPEQLHRIKATIAPPPVDCAPPVPAEGTPAYEALRAEGEEALARGELAAVILAGGMATRFGSVVKALAPMGDDDAPCFLDARLRDVARWRDHVPCALMTSFATHDAIGQWLVANGHASVVRAPQFISLRLNADGSFFHGDDGDLSPFAPGHGDLPEALDTAGLLRAWRARGVRTVLMSNVDNIGATVDPAIYALHRRSKRRVTVELVAKDPGDRGGLPVVHDGKLVLAEAFRLPAGFPAEQFPLFNTNTLWLDLDALEGEHPWTWCVARKKVDGREAIQFERLVGELTWWNETQYVSVPRHGPTSRFIPVKDLNDLDQHREALDQVLSSRILSPTR